MSEPVKLKVLNKRRKFRNAGNLLSIPAAAYELGISDAMLRRAIAEGEIKTVMFVGQRVPRSEVKRILALFEEPEKP